MMSLLRRRMMMATLGLEENKMLKGGYFEILELSNGQSGANGEAKQVNQDIVVAEIDTGLTETPIEIVCAYIDGAGTYVRGTDIFYGNKVQNGWCGNTDCPAFATSFLEETEDFYLRFEPETGTLKLRLRAWQLLKFGKWIWIAIYPE